MGILSNLPKKLGKMDITRGWSIMKKASTFWEKVQRYFGPADDNEPMYEDGESMQESHQPEFSRRNLTVHSSNRFDSKVCIMMPKGYNDAHTCAEKLINRQIILIHYDNVEELEKQRMDDFLNGVCHVLGGNVHYITERHILYTPKNVEIEKELFSYSAPVFRAN